MSELSRPGIAVLVTEAAFWGAYAAVYDAIWDSPLTATLNRTILAALDKAGQGVDLGCGTGLSSRGLVDRGWTVTGVDTSARMLDRAARLGRISHAVQADAARTGLPPAQAGAVLICNTLQLHPDPDAVLDEALRLIAPGGRIVCAWPAESLSFVRVLRQDVNASRPVPRALLAAGLRIAIGIPGGLVGARRWPSPAIRHGVRSWAARHFCRQFTCETLAGVQEYVVLVPAPSGSADAGNQRSGNHRDQA